MYLQGWIKLHRKIQDHWLLQEERKFSKYEAWLDLLMMANHENKKTVLGNEIIEVQRGQRITSLRKLCHKWNWSNTKVNHFLTLLQNDGMIKVKSDSKKTVITIVNYDVYQGRENEETTQNRQENHTTHTEKQTNKNEKELKNDKEDNKPFCRGSKTYDVESVPYKLSLRLLTNIRKNNSKFKEPNLQKWADDFRLMIDRDKRTVEQIVNLIDWCQEDNFWKSNILSPAKLRKQYDQLVMKIKAEEQKNNKKPQHISLERPDHWKEPEAITKDEFKQMKDWEEELPF